MKKIIGLILIMVLTMSVSAMAENCYEEFIMNAEINEFYETNGHLACIIEYHDEAKHVMFVDTEEGADWAIIKVTRNGETTMLETIYQDQFENDEAVTEYMWLINGLIYDGWL